MLFHNFKIRQRRSSMLVCHIYLHPSTQNTNLVGCRYTVGDQIQPLKSLKNIFQHKRSQKSKVTLQRRKSWSLSLRKSDPRASVRPTAKGWCKSLLQEPAAKQLPPSLIVREEMKSWKQQDTHSQSAPQFFSVLISHILVQCFTKWAFGYSTCRIWKLTLTFHLGNFQKLNLHW